MKISSILSAVMQIIGLLQAVILITEDQMAGSTGAEKRTAAITQFTTLLSSLGLPSWVNGLFGNTTIAGVFIDLIVNALNTMGIFKKAGNA